MEIIRIAKFDEKERATIQAFQDLLDNICSQICIADCKRDCPFYSACERNVGSIEEGLKVLVSNATKIYDEDDD